MSYLREGGRRVTSVLLEGGRGVMRVLLEEGIQVYGRYTSLSPVSLAEAHAGPQEGGQQSPLTPYSWHQHQQSDDNLLTQLQK